MTPSQIKFWFQNKRTQTKVFTNYSLFSFYFLSDLVLIKLFQAKQEKEKSIALRALNDEIRGEINEIAQVLEALECRFCGKSCQVGENIFINQQKLRAENALLKEEVCNCACFEMMS